MTQYWTWRVMSGLLRALPVSISYRLATLAGKLAFYGWPRGRRATTRNFAVVLGPGARRSTIRSTARRSMENYCKYLVDFARYSELRKGTVLRHVPDSEPYVRLAGMLGEHRGVLAACMHFGNWDLGAAATVAHGIPATAVSETFGDPRLDEAVLGARRGAGLDVVTVGSGAPSMFRALKRGRVLAVVIDRPTPGQGVRIEFFGRSTEVPDGAARLALRAAVPVVAAAFPRVHPVRPDIETWTDFGIPLPARAAADPVWELTQSLFHSHESFIRRCPSQWYMFREMWPDRRDQG